MIRSIRSKPLRLFTERGNPSRLPVKNHARLTRMLRALDAATEPQDMALPGYGYHPLEGKPQRYAAEINGNCRLTWAWEDGDAIDVDVEDYH